MSKCWSIISKSASESMLTCVLALIIQQMLCILHLYSAIFYVKAVIEKIAGFHIKVHLNHLYYAIFSWNAKFILSISSYFMNIKSFNFDKPLFFTLRPAFQFLFNCILHQIVIKIVKLSSTVSVQFTNKPSILKENKFHFMMEWAIFKILQKIIGV